MNDQNFRKQSYDQINDITQNLRFLRKKKYALKDIRSINRNILIEGSSQEEKMKKNRKQQRMRKTQMF